MAVVVTVPHSAPSNVKTGHPVDTLAQEAGISIFDKLDPPKKIYVNFSVPRNLCDLNRPPGDCGFVPFLTEYLEKNKIRLLIDIHSYPNNYDSWKAYDVVFIDSAPFNSIGLNNLLTEEGIKSGIAKSVDCKDSKKCNYIISLAKIKHENPAFIIEFNEDLDSKKLRRITSLIAESINTL